jgi:GINS complex subunit 1
VLPEKIQQETLSTKENEFYSAYNELLGEYTEELGVDLLADYEPPKDLYIEIRALESCGEIMTENGPINLEPGATTFVKRSDVAHLILQGKVKHVLADK